MLEKLWEGIRQAVTQLQVLPQDVLDILILTFVVYQLIKITRETRAFQLLKGFAMLIVAAQISDWLSLSGLSWVLNSVVNAGVIAMVILFQPELRRALERLGSGAILETPTLTGAAEEEQLRHTADELTRAVQNLAKKRTGALIVLQRRNTLVNIMESGTAIDSRLSAALLENIFIPNTPLHDGAVIVRGDRIAAAGCFLPLTTNNDLDLELGTRHRAALGMSETTDAVVIIVSEETGIISLAEGGKLTRYLDPQGLRRALDTIYRPREKTRKRLPHFGSLSQWRKRNDEKPDK